MDTFAHSLWAYGASKVAGDKYFKKEKSRKPLKHWLSAFFGALPDIFAFFLPAIASIVYLIFGGDLAEFGREAGAGIYPDNLAWSFETASFLYQISHSLVVFLIVFGLVWWWRKKPLWEMLGWALHVLTDMPLHTPDVSPTPFLWPVSDWVLPFGVLWSSLSVLYLTYFGLLILFVYLYYLEKKKRLV